MRVIAITLNVILIATVIYFVSSSSSDLRGKDLAFFVLFISAPAASLLAFYFSAGENWLSLFLRRKALEEKAKIEQLNVPRRP
jgi:hypothetical protein